MSGPNTRPIPLRRNLDQERERELAAMARQEQQDQADKDKEEEANGRKRKNRRALCAALGTSLAASIEILAAWLGKPFPAGGGAALGGAFALVCTYINTPE